MPRAQGRLAVACLLGVLQLGVPRLAVAAPGAAPTEQEMFAEVNAAYAAGDFAGAAALLDEAFARDAQPKYLYTKGEILIVGQDCPGAVKAFRRFLQTEPPAEDAAAARQRIEGCTGKPEPTGGVVPHVEPTTAPSGGGGDAALGPDDPTNDPTNDPTDDPTKDATGSDASTPRPRRSPRPERVVLGLGIGGGALALAGAGLWIGGRVAANRAPQRGTEGDWEASVERSRNLSTAGAVVVSVAGAVVIAAVISAVVGRRSRVRNSEARRGRRRARR